MRREDKERVIREHFRGSEMLGFGNDAAKLPAMLPALLDNKAKITTGRFGYAIAGYYFCILRVGEHSRPNRAEPARRRWLRVYHYKKHIERTQAARDNLDIWRD